MKSNRSVQSGPAGQSHICFCILTNKNRWSSVAAALLAGLLLSLPAAAQPSGGPYGPIRQTYELPKDAKTIYYVAPDGKPEASGKTPAEPTTLESAVRRVVTGDAVILRGGTYRTGGLRLNQAVTMQPYADEQPVLKGTYVAENWERQRNGLWVTSWDHLFPARPADWWRPSSFGRSTPLHKFNNDMVFVDGAMLQSAGWEGEVDENSFYINYDTKQVMLSIDPTDKAVEITAFESALTRTVRDCHGKKSDGKGPVIRGITFTCYAYRAMEIEGKDPQGLSHEADHGKDVTGTRIEHCTISFCSRVAGYFRGDGMTIRHCLVSDTSTEGIYILSSSDVLLEKNIFTRNNVENINGYYPAAVKIFNQCYRVTCRDNLVIDLPNSNGIWYDVGNVEGVFVNNWIQNVGRTDRPFNSRQFWPSDNGFFFEISKGVVCAGNVFVNCDQGIFILNSCDARVYQNTLINSTVVFGRTPRSAEGDHFGWHPSAGPDVDQREGHVFVNNLLTADQDYTRPLLVTWQTPELCRRLNKPMMKKLDSNVYVRTSGADSALLLWSPADNADCRLAFNSLDGLRRHHPQCEANGQEFKGYNGPLFQSLRLGHFRLLENFPGHRTAVPLPVEVSKLLGLSEDQAPYIGAYPPNP